MNESLRVEDPVEIKPGHDYNHKRSAGGKNFSQPLGIKGHAFMVNDKERICGFPRGRPGKYAA